MNTGFLGPSQGNRPGAMASGVKICGLCRVEDALLAAELGADALGFVLVPGAKREVQVQLIHEVRQALRLKNRREPPLFAVVTDPDHQKVRGTFWGLDGLQLHGSETPEVCRRIRQDNPGLRLIKAISRTDDANRARWIDLVREGGLDALLVDSATGGGSGTPADWAWAKTLAAETRVGLAGGLGPQNVAEAMATVRPCYVDVSSGVEAELRAKDPVKLRLFIEEAHRARRETAC